MTDIDLVERAAIAAIAASADQLNVDPLQFAKFLQNGRIAELLLILGREEEMAAHRADIARMNKEYITFLEEEVRRCRDRLKSIGGGE